MLHVFDNVCNLITADDRVISLVTPHIGDGPFNLVLPPVRFTDYVTADSHVFCDRGVLSVGDLEVDMTGACVWEPRPAWEKLRRELSHLQVYLRCLISMLGVLAPTASFAGLVVRLPMPSSRVEGEMLYAARISAEKLVAGLQLEDLLLCIEGADGLAGLGGGLTPDGDDFLLGCSLAAWVKFPRRAAGRITHRIYEVASLRTTTFSAACLRAAAKGECTSVWHSLFSSLLCRSEDAVYKTAKRVIQQGHTSGASALAGFLAVLTGDQLRTNIN